MEHPKLVDLVLKELMNTRQPSLSIRRILEKNRIEYDDDLINSIETILRSKSLVEEKTTGSRGYPRYALTFTGQDFVRTFGTYSKFLKGIESENKKIERARNKKPYVTKVFKDGAAPAPFTPADESFLKRNRLGFIILAVVLALFFIVSKITELHVN